jgi:hypothetical protein
MLLDFIGLNAEYYKGMYNEKDPPKNPGTPLALKKEPLTENQNDQSSRKPTMD